MWDQKYSFPAPQSAQSPSILWSLQSQVSTPLQEGWDFQTWQSLSTSWIYRVFPSQHPTECLPNQRWRVSPRQLERHRRICSIEWAIKVVVEMIPLQNEVIGMCNSGEMLDARHHLAVVLTLQQFWRCKTLSTGTYVVWVLVEISISSTERKM